MSKLRLHLAGLALVLTGLTTLSQSCQAFAFRPHHGSHSEQQEVLHVEDEVRTALLNADASALDRVLADDFLGISANGTLSDKQQYLRRIGQKQHRFSRIEVTDRKVRLQPASAIVVTTADVIGQLDATPLRGVFRYTRVYSRQGDGPWKLRNFEATRVSGAAQDEMSHGVPVPRSR